jgi:hypothetical protein
LSYVFVLTNFSDATYNTSGFPYTGTWYNLMDDTPLTVTATNQSVSIEPGGFRVFGNKPSTILGTENFALNNTLAIYPNPGKDYFSLNTATTDVSIYSVTGQLVKSFRNPMKKDAQFNIGDLKKGLYLIKVEDDKNKEQTIKFIKD